MEHLFCGVEGEDGTRLPFIGTGGMTSDTGGSMESAYVQSAFIGFLELNQVATIKKMSRWNRMRFKFQ